MCINPRRLDNGVEVGCRKCWQCKENRVNDWVGRCIAESKTASCTRSVTLTYGEDADGRKDHPRTAVLTYSDVQKWFKKLRKAGHVVRYFCVGEFGSEKGRAHWHLILFFEGKSPTHELNKRLVQAQWDFGWSFWEKIDDLGASVRYVCKYIQKDLRDAERQRQVSMSRFPALGAVYFSRLAGRYVDQGISPQQPSYHFPDVVDKHGETIKFRMLGRSREWFVDCFLQQWADRYRRPPPHSEMVEERLDELARYAQEFKPKPFRPGYGRPWIKPPQGGEVVFSEVHNGWVWLGRTETLFWSFDDEGRRAWHARIRTETEAERLRAASERRAALPTYEEMSRGESGKPIRLRR